MERYLNKKYRLTESENYDAYLKRNKVKFFFRKMEQIVKQTIKLSEKDGKYVFEVIWPMTSSAAVFRTGLPFEELNIDGTVTKSVIDFKDNKLIHTQYNNDIKTVTVREYSDKQVKSSIVCEDIICSRMYTRVYEK